MTPEDLRELREKFRERFKTHDFCLGEKETEEFFRELLNEPKPEESKYIGKPLTSEELTFIFNNVISKEKLMATFDRDDTFYKAIKKR